MRWFNTAGGPFVILPIEILPTWGGFEESSFAGFASPDYDEACQILDFVGVISNGRDSALVLADEPHQTAIRVTSSGILLIRWIHAASESKVLDAIQEIGENSFVLDKYLDIRSSEMVMFDSAIPGSSVNVDDWGRFSLSMGRNVIETVEYSGEETCIILHRIRLSSES
ncbi:hypothetical protein DTL42_18990 [Bremerella cremea]|uniref:Uncharacterized protein n=1 Tax=Bremerella cremea TaxID=1031537 RepID=A0A368KPZ6_9BACT|nr:Imm21 family immunity protein [Bremerella cremea]RCS43244.1 hypothetical protein DTL42_18990 [Bremerella cremea]